MIFKRPRKEPTVVWGIFISLSILVISGCGKGSSPSWNAVYIEDVQLITTDDVYASSPFHFEPGEHWLLWLSASERRGGILFPSTNNLRITNIFLVFDEQPESGQILDLAKTPLAVSYEYGGEVRTYISRQASGTLALSSPNGNLQAELEATFFDPLLGEGERRVEITTALKESPLEDWRHLGESSPSPPQMRDLVLPAPDLPDDVVVLYEHIVIDSERSDNWRFYVRDDGAFFNARNEELWVAREDWPSDDPALFWNTPFAAEPTRRLTAAQFSEFLQALETADVAALRTYYPDANFESTTSPWVERWTFVLDGEVVTILIECEATPAQLADLHQTLTRLLVEAPVGGGDQ